MGRIEEVHLIRADPEQQPGEAATLLAAELALRIGSPEVEVRERRDADAIRELKARQLVIVPVASWELLAALPAPPDGAAVLLVPEPAIAFAVAAGTLVTSST